MQTSLHRAVPIDLRRLEELSLNSSPAPQQLLFDGWILRFSKGSAKRAKSVNPFYPSTLDVREKVARCERLYVGQGLAPLFRITPLCTPPHLDTVLAELGYRRFGETAVQIADLRDALPEAPAGFQLVDQDEWQHLDPMLRGSTKEAGAALAQRMQAVPLRQQAALVLDSGQAVASGLAILEDEWVGLFNLVTATGRRGRGHGARLVAGLLAWAQAQGAAHAYLQVEKDNASGQRLYARFGFSDAYTYWYRVKESPA